MDRKPVHPVLASLDLRALQLTSRPLTYRSLSLLFSLITYQLEQDTTNERGTSE